MNRFTLFTYENVEEFNRLYTQLEDEGRCIHSFVFRETMLLLENESNLTIDISALVEYLKLNPADDLGALANFESLDDTSQVIIKSKLADEAMDIFCTLFKDVESLFEIENQESTDLFHEDKLAPFERRILYTYESNSQLNNIIDFANENEITFVNFSFEDEKFKLKDNNERKTLVDITNITKLILEKPHLIYGVEQSLNSFTNFDVTIRDDLAEKALDSYNLLFKYKKPISKLLTGISLDSDDVDDYHEQELIRITDLSPSKLNEFHRTFSLQLFGHDRFKEECKESIENFIVLNRIDEKKVFSIFLLGNSGLGKTEVARIMKTTLNEHTPLVKINFGNYSSKDALNSLIGSPRGYQGMDEGELSIKVKKSKAGIILCDEIEKATPQIFNFFLELLEDGVFTDSMSREYNLDGYIIIFTSNVNRTIFKEYIPPEFQSRLDIVSEFDPLTPKEKADFVNHQIKIFIEKLVDKNKDHEFSVLEFSKDDIDYFKGIDTDSTDNLRDIKRNLRERMLNRLRKHLKESNLEDTELENSSEKIKIGS